MFIAADRLVCFVTLFQFNLELDEFLVGMSALELNQAVVFDNERVCEGGYLNNKLAYKITVRKLGLHIESNKDILWLLANCNAYVGALLRDAVIDFRIHCYRRWRTHRLLLPSCHIKVMTHLLIKGRRRECIR